MLFKSRRNRSQKIARYLLGLFVLLLGFCPVKRIFFQHDLSSALYQKAKTPLTSPQKKTSVETPVSTGLCGQRFLELKQTIKAHPNFSVDFSGLIASFFLLVLFIAIFDLKPALLHKYLVTRGTSIPLFLRNRILLI